MSKHLVMSFFDKEQNVEEVVWSGRFKIDRVGEFVVKLYNKELKRDS